ncbi:sialate O-acetylesterase [Paraflavisolibacter sp. H34]|uniref:sialate O-acetylesterase n=1 Tax=Huijunlia imazamoxiresistens TaxID=3127457 RepID=UPI003018A455
MYKLIGLLLFILVFLSLPAFAKVQLPAFFSDNMVLQQKSHVRIWGTAAAGEKVGITPSWNHKKYTARTNTSGRWEVDVETPAAGGPFTLEIKGKNRIVLQNILIGEVWLCSGQSNMDMPVKGFWGAPVLHANDLLVEAPNSRIRLFHVARKASGTPLADVAGKWAEADVASVKEFSAVGYQFARLLQRHLGVPVGVIQSSWGGSPIEAWMNASSLDSPSKANGLTGGATTRAPHQTPSNLFNGMIAPLAGYGLAGVLWYQGEQNRFNYRDYALLQPSLVREWRRLWGRGDWPFYYVQIAPMRYPQSQKALLPYFREVQQQLAAQIPNAGMAVSIDAGEEDNIHPANKEVIAKRLAFLALSRTYGKTGIAASGPQYQSFAVSGDTLSLRFSGAPMGMTVAGKELTQFEVAGADKVFYKAWARLKGTTVQVRSEAVPHPVAARYAFSDWAVGELYSAEGLPVAPFRTDDW